MSSTDEQRRNRSGCAVAIVVTLVLLLGLVLVADLGVSSFVCMDSQGDNMTCALRVVAGHLGVYVAAIAVIALVTYGLRRWTR